ncbi:cell division protein FtsX [Lichenibacterium dinghuense]|uniref:cell division protein FtsX n=1 Tax=Lichenibacterium dinghuense TaxID=2895977 RepID=UPI001F3BC64A|nr:ABC transporter permease [Lichenibacterium sp. 6Y81]
MGEPAPGRLRREAPLVPAGSVAGRALVSVVAIMTFLASLAAGAALLVAGASRDWQASIAREATVQVLPAAGRDIEADVGRAAALAAAAPGVASVEPYGAERAAKLLEPWLGSGLDLADVPVPRLIAVQLGSGAGFDAAALAAALAAAVPGATLDDHGAWRARLGAAAGALEAVAVALCTLVLAALALAVGFATRGAMAGNREIIGVLHFVGAEDSFIAREFQRRFLRLGLQGATIGSGLAALSFPLAGLAADRLAGADGVEALFGRFALGPWGYGAIALTAAVTALLTGWTSRAIVVRHLRDLA